MRELREDLRLHHRGPRPLLKIAEVARVLRISERSAEKLVAAGELRPIEVGGVRRFDPAAIEAYLRSRVRRRRRSG